MSLTERGRAVRETFRAREQALDWVTFSDGPGRCPGQHFNVHEFLLVLDALLPRYRFEPVRPEATSGTARRWWWDPKRAKWPSESARDAGPAAPDSLPNRQRRRAPLGAHARAPTRAPVV